MAIGSNLWKKTGNHSKMGSMGQNGRQVFGLHMIAVDSKGNIYTGEVFNGENAKIHPSSRRNAKELASEDTMKLAFRLLFCGLIVVIGAGLAVRGGATPAAPQATGGPTVTGDLMKDWTAQKSTLMLIADAMPADKFGYKPTVIQRSYGEQIMHVAQTNVDLLKLMGGKAAVPEFTADSAKSKAEVLKALSDSYDYGIALLKEQTDTTVSQVVRAPAFVGTGAGAIFLGPSTRARIFWFLLGHSMDIYGQMAVYLRLNGVVPPASRG